MGRNSLVLAEVRWQASLVASDVVWWPAGPAASRESATALIVSYNTRELTAFLLWSLRTIVSWPELEIVVVDNGSRDGSPQLLAEAGRGGVCTLLANHGNRHHGPGLNQGISYLASRPGPGPRGSGSWTPTSSPRGPARCPQPSPWRGNTRRPWSASRSTTSGTPTGASGSTRC